MPHGSGSSLRIVSLAPSATSILCSIGARRCLVGVTKWCADVAPVSNLPKLGDCWHMNSVEPILRLKPTLVIGSVPYKPETVAKLLNERLNFLAMNPRSLADIYGDIQLLGGLVRKSPEAERLIARMQGTFANVNRSSVKRKRHTFDGVKATDRKPGPPRVYCEAWPNPRISSPPWVAELVELVGGVQACDFGAKIADEEVAAANPDVIVLAWAAVGDRAKPQRAYAVPAWKNVAAIRNRQVHVIRDEWLNTPGPPLLRGARELARIIAKFSEKG